MKPFALLLAAGLAATSTVAAFARDRPGQDWIPLDQAYRAITEAGYRDVTSIKADDGRWEAKVIKDGLSMKVLVDPRTAAVSEKPKKAKKAKKAEWQ